MKKILTVLMMVFGLSVVFADSYVAFTSEEEFEEYCNSDHSEWDAQQKALFEEAAASFSAKQKKNMKLISVWSDTGVIKKCILVYHYDSEKYGVMVVEDNYGITLYRMVYVYEKTDPVMIGLSFIKDQVTHIVDIDNQKDIFESYNMLKE